MAENEDGQEKTEEPTQKRLEKAAEDGTATDLEGGYGLHDIGDGPSSLYRSVSLC